MSIFEAFRRAMLGLLVAVLCGLVFAAVFVGYCAYTLPLTRSPAAEPPPAAVTYNTGTGTPFAAHGIYRGDRLTADHLPPDLVRAVVAIEDRRFFQHGGIDPRGMLRAAWHNLWSRGGIEGGSTITQQLARLTYLSPERTMHRKVQEIMLALWFESRLSKEEILARYLNTVYFGAGAVGADAAAKRYFGKKAGDLSLAEAAMLAGLIRAPSQLAPSRNPEAARKRADLVLREMIATGVIDQPQAAAARGHPATLRIAPEPEPGDNYYIDTAEAEVRRLVGTPPLDLSVTTTFDPRLQDAADQIVRRWLAGEGARRHAGQAALIAMAPDGAILAMVGGRDYSESQFNRATQARRQPGSLFKVFVYLTALSNGYTPDSVMTDQQVQIGDWQPRNFDGRYHGPVPLRTAFAQSLNSVSVQLVQAVGIERVIATAKSLGVQAELPAVPSLALGSAEVTLLDMTRAMDAIATDTKSIEPYMVRSIRAQGATPLYTRPETTAGERPDWNRAGIMRLLEAVVTEGTGRAARLAETPGRRAAGKTGTTDEYRDAWFVGFTTDLVVGVWVGNDDDSPMDQVTGGDIPAKIWHDFVVEAEKIVGRPNPAAAAPVIGSATAPSAQPEPAPPIEPPPAPPAAPPAAVAAAPPAPPPAAPSQPRPVQPAAAAPRLVHGIPLVVDTATLILQGTVVHLQGVEGEKGEPTHELVRYLAGREVSCQPADPAASQYRCRVGDYDLGEAVVLNGAGRAAADAPEHLRDAEQRARGAGRGLWRQ
jgi:penicillin-binding protein 1A